MMENQNTTGEAHFEPCPLGTQEQYPNRVHEPKSVKADPSTIHADRNEELFLLYVG